MKTFDSIIILGDSWSRGSELPETCRMSNRFGNLLAQRYNVPCINLARESATNFCYKWHWFDWSNSKPTVLSPLVIVGITGPNRHLIYNNQADFFQESPNRLVSENTVRANWGNKRNGGGFMRAFSNHIDFTNVAKKRCQENFYRYNYNDEMAEISVIWEIKLLDLMVREYGGHPIFWSNFHSYEQVSWPWAQLVLNNDNLVNNLQPLNYNKDCFFYQGSHPNADGHQHIMTVLEQFING
jgi:hypothetical protein